MDFLSILLDFKNYFITIGAILGAIPTYIKVIKPRYINFKNYFTSINDNLSKISKISEMLGPNGGKSLYDAVKSIDLRLLVSENYLTMVFGHLKIGIIRFNDSGECIYVSPEFSRMVGRPESDFIKNNWVQLIKNYEEIRNEFDNIIELKRMGTLKTAIIDNNNNFLTMLMYIHPINNSNKLEYIATISQI